MGKFTKEMVDEYAEKLLIGLTDEENKMVLDEFEIIEIDSWDPVTRIVTFKTNSFSNFAIAEKPVNKGNGGNPGTGDDINTYFNMLFIGVIGFLSTLIIKKKKEVK